MRLRYALAMLLLGVAGTAWYYAAGPFHTADGKEANIDPTPLFTLGLAIVGLVLLASSIRRGRKW